MSMVCQKDARMRGFDFMYRAVFKETYSASLEVSELAFNSKKNQSQYWTWMKSGGRDDHEHGLSLHFYGLGLILGQT